MSENQKPEVKAISRLLSKTAELAENASLTGGFEDGTARCVHQFNIAVAQLEVLEAIPKGFFAPLSEDAGYGSIGVACSQLASYIGEEQLADGGATYHGPKYNVMHHNDSSISKEDLQELRELKEMLRRERGTSRAE